MINHIPQHKSSSMDAEKTVLNILTGRWINPNGKLFQKLIREGYRYANRLSDYLEDIGTMNIGEFELDPLIDFYYPALIPPLSVLAIRADICKNFPISVESAVMGGASLFTLEKNKRPALQNLIHKNYPSNSLSILIEMSWDHEETRAWRDEVLKKFLHHPNLAPSKHRPGALYDIFTLVNVLGPEHILALERI